MAKDMKTKLEALLGIRLTRTERDILAHVKREAQKLLDQPVRVDSIGRTRVYDILESVVDRKPRIVGYRRTIK